MCDDIGMYYCAGFDEFMVDIPLAGTARYAELKPETSFLAQKNNKCLAHDSHQIPPTSSVIRQKPQSRPGDASKKDAFEGDDIDLDGLLAVGSFQKKSKQADGQNTKPADDIDWISINSTPSPPRSVAGVPQRKDGEWAADMGAQEEDYEPVRLANGNWACNHKCKDKTRCLCIS